MRVNKKFGDVVKEYIIPIFLFIITGVVSTFLFNKIDKLDDRIYEMNEKVTRIEAAVGEMTNKVGEFKSMVVDNYDDLDDRIKRIEDKVFQ